MLILKFLNELTRLTSFISFESLFQFGTIRFEKKILLRVISILFFLTMLCSKDKFIQKLIFLKYPRVSNISLHEKIRNLNT